MLRVVMYHYVRDLLRSRFPKIKGMLTADFAAQVAALAERHEMATLETALRYLDGAYAPSRDLCLLTFDDGLREHYAEVTPILAERRIQGIFGLITECVELHRVALVHKNHFLMAALEFGDYERGFRDELARIAPDVDVAVDPAVAARTYRWDTPEVAAFKYLLNFKLPERTKSQILDALFARHLGDEAQFARELYLSWDEAREMQAAGMLLGGHTHRHLALASLSDAEQRDDLATCTRLLKERLRPQDLWPFTYPYGKRDSFNEHTVATLRALGYACGFATEVGDNEPGQSRYEIRRIDPKDVSKAPIG
jgi:peptidoglycan/xylan/chitin deacetylase (PgdA/CDA1 family)